MHLVGSAIREKPANVADLSLVRYAQGSGEGPSRTGNPERKQRAWGAANGVQVPKPEHQGGRLLRASSVCGQQYPFRGGAASLAQHYGAFKG